MKFTFTNQIGLDHFLEGILKRYDAYGSVTLAEAYFYAKKPYSYTDTKYGWTKLEPYHVCSDIENSEYSISLPACDILENENLKEEEEMDYVNYNNSKKFKQEPIDLAAIELAQLVKQKGINRYTYTSKIDGKVTAEVTVYIPTNKKEKENEND